ncbi:hypothetical protein ACG7TL_009258 [Trametes sanguinea]
METLDATPLAAELNHTFGALLLGTYFGFMLYGFMIHRSYTYFHDYPKDAKVNKIFVSESSLLISGKLDWQLYLAAYQVALLLVLETAHSTAALHFWYVLYLNH